VEARNNGGKKDNCAEHWYLISGVPVRVSSDSEKTLIRLRYLFGHFHHPAPLPKPRIDYRIDFKPRNRRPFILWKNAEDRPVYRTADESELVAFLEKSITYSVLSELEGYLLVHAGAVQLNGCGLILPARSGNGKSLLVMGLMASGWKLLSDDAAVIDEERATVLPFPTSLCFKQDSKALLGHYNLTPGQRNSFITRDRVVYYFNPLDINPRCIGEPCPIRHIVFPRFNPSGKTVLKEISRAEAAFRLIQNSFNFGGRGASSLDGLADLVGKAHCFELNINRLETGVRVLRDLS
jgi:hypothetical protein